MFVDFLWEKYMKKHIEYLEIQEKSNNAKPSAYKVVHVQLDYYPTDNTLTFKLLKDGTIQFWAYYEEQFNIWDKLYGYEEMVISKNELIPVLEYLQKIYVETAEEVPQIRGNDNTYTPIINFLYENFSLIDNNNRKLLKEICKFFQLSDYLIFSDDTMHLIFKKLSEFFLWFFIQHEKYVYENNYHSFGYYDYYNTLCDLKRKLIAKKLITDKELGKIQ